MWKLLPALLLVSCTTQEPNENASGAGVNPDSSRIVETLDLPLRPALTPGVGQPAARAFQGRDVQGQVDESGAWTIRKAVAHTRLRCATYETGIQLGRGDADCSDVQWLSTVQFGTRQTHCNSATLIHTGGGELAIPMGTFEASNCVRVLTRCNGNC